MGAIHQITLTQQQLEDLEGLVEQGADDLAYAISNTDHGDYSEEEIEEQQRRATEGYESVCAAIAQRKTFDEEE